MPVQAFNASGFRRFYDRDISDFTERDQIQVYNIVKHHVQQFTIEGGVPEDAIATDLTVILNAALRRAGDELLSDHSVLTLEAKGFIRDHCIC